MIAIPSGMVVTIGVVSVMLSVAVHVSGNRSWNVVGCAV